MENLQGVLFIIVLVCVWMMYRRERAVGSARRVVLHYVDWCGYCKAARPVWDRVKAAIPPNIMMTEVDQDVAKTPGITRYPTIIMLDENGKRSQFQGPIEYTKLIRWITAPVVVEQAVGRRSKFAVAF